MLGVVGYYGLEIVKIEDVFLKCSRSLGLRQFILEVVWDLLPL